MRLYAKLRPLRIFVLFYIQSGVGGFLPRDLGANPQRADTQIIWSWSAPEMIYATARVAAKQEESVMARHWYPAVFKFWFVLEALSFEKTPSQIAKEIGCPSKFSWHLEDAIHRERTGDVRAR